MSEILQVVSWIFFVMGLVGIFKFKNFYARLMTSSKIDSATVILLLTALIFYVREGYFTSRYLLIMLFILITNPVTTHLIARKKFREDSHDGH